MNNIYQEWYYTAWHCPNCDFPNEPTCEGEPLHDPEDRETTCQKCGFVFEKPI